MYKTYLKHGKVFFYENGIEINGIVYGVRSEEDIRRIKRNLASSTEHDDPYDIDKEITKIIHTDVAFEQPATEQLAKIQSKRFENPKEARAFADEVMSGTHKPSQDEINAAVMLEIAKLKAGV